LLDPHHLINTINSALNFQTIKSYLAKRKLKKAKYVEEMRARGVLDPKGFKSIKQRSLEAIFFTQIFYGKGSFMCSHPTPAPETKRVLRLFWLEKLDLSIAI
jgi:hypothetical protein